MTGGIAYDDALKYRDVFQQRNDAENDDDDTRDLLGATVERQQVDQIENENNDKKCDEHTDKHLKTPCERVR
jgi:hypothetical protein